MCETQQSYLILSSAEENTEHASDSVAASVASAGAAATVLLKVGRASCAYTHATVYGSLLK